MSIDVQAAYWLVLAPLPLLLYWFSWRFARERLPRINLDFRFAAVRSTWRTSLGWLPTAFRLAGIVVFVIAAARPYDWTDSRWSNTQGVAIELVIDRSGSMRRDDYEIDGQRVSRLKAVADAAASFVVGDRADQRAPQDMIGLISFARNAEAVCPLTLDHEQVVAHLEAMDTAVDYREDGTAVGDAIGLAVAELQSLQQSLQTDVDPSPLSRVIILLTDGQQNAGQLSTEQATRLARHYGIVLHTISLDPSMGQSSVTRQRLAAESERLKAIAAVTGGQFFSVDSSQSLHEVYELIDRLERRALPERSMRIPREYAVAWFSIGPVALPPLLLIGLAMLLFEWLLRATILPDMTQVI